VADGAERVCSSDAFGASFLQTVEAFSTYMPAILWDDLPLLAIATTTAPQTDPDDMHMAD
jgi:hypothetical protein